MTDHALLLAKQLPNCDENTLTKQLIVPLFERLGYERVEFYGGSDEQGKDLVCWRLDELGDVELTVVQVKHFKLSKRASDKRALESVVNQLHNAATKPLLYIDRTEHLPHKVLLISTYPVDTKAIQKRFGAWSALKDIRIRLIDGPRLATLLINHVPNLVTDLFGPKFQLAALTTPILTNDVLLTLLGHQRTRTLKEIYTDIDFAMGTPTTALFFNATLEPTTTTVRCSDEEHKSLKTLIADCHDHLPIGGVFSILRVRDDTRLKADLERLEGPVSLRSKNVLDLTDDLASKEKQLLTAVPALKDVRSEQNRLQNRRNSLDREGQQQLDVELNLLASRIATLEQPLYKPRRDLIAAKGLLRETTAEVSGLREQLRSPPWRANVDGPALATILLDKRSYVSSTITTFNQTSPTDAALRTFVTEYAGIVSAVAAILNHPITCEALGVPDDTSIRTTYAESRLSLPVHRLFATGENLVILGEAGAGKSTSIMMYAQEQLEVEARNGLVVFAPLIRLVKAWRGDQPRLLASQNRDRLEQGLVRYLSTLGITVAAAEFEVLLDRPETVVLLDGVDEAIKEARWLTSAICSFAERHPDIQVVVTSRLSGSYIEGLPFLSVTLLPFSEHQRDQFIARWFDTDEHWPIAIKKHLHRNPEMAQIVRNPLLTTILCVLAEAGVPLPDSELRMYEERIGLLTGGYYDLAKGVSRVKSQKHVLETVARAIAFGLHTAGRRESRPASLSAMAKRLLQKHVSAFDVTRAVDELIDPCNVLVPMTDDGKYGFGHLRYQEFLAAKEMSVNRSVDVMPLLGRSWWRGTCEMFAQMQQNMAWLVDQAVARGVHHGTGLTGEVAETLLAMIKYRPKGERGPLKEIVSSNLSLVDPGPLDEEEWYVRQSEALDAEYSDLDDREWD